MFRRLTGRPQAGPTPSFFDLEAVLPVGIDVLVTGGGEPADVLLLHPLALRPELVDWAGDINALFRYVLMFVAGLDGIPRLVQRLTACGTSAGAFGSSGFLDGFAQEPESSTGGEYIQGYLAAEQLRTARYHRDLPDRR
jgi:hypothetical protein